MDVSDWLDRECGERVATLRGVFEAVLQTVGRTCPGTRVVPKAGYLALLRRSQFGLVSREGERVALALVLPEAQADARLRPVDGFSTAVTHCVLLADVPEVDVKVESWLRRAWERA